MVVIVMMVATVASVVNARNKYIYMKYAGVSGGVVIACYDIAVPLHEPHQPHPRSPKQERTKNDGKRKHIANNKTIKKTNCQQQ